MIGTMTIISHSPRFRRRSSPPPHAARPARMPRLRLVLLCVSRLLPVVLQAALVITAVISRSWMLVMMSATSLAMSVATTIESFAGLHSSSLWQQGSQDHSPVAEDADSSDGITTGTRQPGQTVSVEEAARSAIDAEPLARLLGLPETAGMPTGIRGSGASGRTADARCDDRAAHAQTTAGGIALWRLCVRHWYAHRHESAHLAAPIGRDGRGNAVVLDLVQDGPHALVAGMTGSGKSVLLEDWCAALALTYPPSRLNFVFLDFKGGATFRHLRHLPHTAGSVSDLSLAMAKRALAGLEQELRRRERLLGRHHAARIEQLAAPPPRLLVVVDEFNALRTMLPDYLPRLSRLASQGRSLGMHLILSTQSPSAEVPRTMQANIGTSICLRVRDPLQSSELVGTRAAAALPADRPGTAICAGGGSTLLVRAPLPTDRTAQTCALARMFLTTCCRQNPTPARSLFTPPLPRRYTLERIRGMDTAQGNAGTGPDESSSRRPEGLRPVVIGLADDGVRTHPAVLDPSRGNIAVCGPAGRGKTHLCALLCRLLPDLEMADDVDTFLDPLCDDADATRLRRRLQDSRTRTVYAVRDPRLVRFPAQCATRVFFPTGDRSADMLAGIPATAMADWEQEDLSCPGRALLADDTGWTTIQIADG
jgi:S-DNA-T family DNA segregation ATPase FtsK/SpoIIIE